MTDRPRTPSLIVICATDIDVRFDATIAELLVIRDRLVRLRALESA